MGCRVADPKAGSAVVRLSSNKCLREALSRLEGRVVYFIDSLGVNLSARITRFCIKRKGHNIGLLRIQHLVEPKQGLLKQAYKKIKSAKGLYIRIINLCLKLTFPAVKYDFIIYAGAKYRGKKIPKNIETCSYDVATFNNMTPYEKNVEKYGSYGQRYIVFLDNGSYVHPDGDECQLYIKGDLISFTNNLKKAFGHLEEQLQAQVIIAAHPKVPRDHYLRFYSDYLVEYGQSAALTKGAVASCMINSASVSFAVLANKPLYILTDRNHEESYIGDYQMAVATELGTMVLDIQKLVEIQELFTCIEGYAKFVENYLATQSALEQCSVWAPFIDAVIRGEV